MRGIVRYFDRKSTHLLNKLTEIKISPKFIKQKTINPLFTGKTGVQSYYPGLSNSALNVIAINETGNVYTGLKLIQSKHRKSNGYC